MRLAILAIGRLKAGPEETLCDRYLERLAKAGPAIGLEFSGLTQWPESRLPGVGERRIEEARRIAGVLPERAALIALDERGRDLATAELSARIARFRDDGRRDLVFAIGGPDGLDESLRARAELVLSFGRLTWPHQLVRVLLAEQLYRVATVLSGHPYHRE